MDQALIEPETKGDIIYCPGCGEELKVPKPKVTEVIYHPAKPIFSSYADYPPYVEVHFQEAVSVGHRCPDPTRDKVTTLPETVQPAGRFRLWN